MNKKQAIGLIGSVILFLGVFAPIVSMPFLGSINYFLNGKGDGTIIIVLAVVSLILIFNKNYKWLWLTGLCSLGVLAFTFVSLQMKIAELRLQMDKELAGNPFRGLADIVVEGVQLQWGWAILIVGAVLVIAAAAIKDEAL